MHDACIFARNEFGAFLGNIALVDVGNVSDSNIMTARAFIFVITDNQNSKTYEVLDGSGTHDSASVMGNSRSRETCRSILLKKEKEMPV